MTTAKKKGRLKFVPWGFKLRVGRSRAGLGLFTEEEIPKGACIIEYVGRIISAAEEYTNKSKYLFEIHARKTVDGRQRNNIARYINHSCRPNADPEIRKHRIYIMALRKIKAGEEILYNYGEEYWDEHIGPKLCRCDKCREKRVK